MKRRIWLSLLLIGFVGLLLLFTIRLGDMPFETIAQGDGDVGYGGEMPTLVIIADPQQVVEPGLDIQFRPDLMERLRTINYNQYFVIVALQGLRGSSGYQITVKRVARQADEVAVFAEFLAPAVDEVTNQVFTSPSHLIQVSKENGLSGPVTFVLRNRFEVVAQTTIQMP